MNRHRGLAVGVLLVLATLAVYWPVQQFDFVDFDDDIYITENPVVINGLTPEGFRWAFSSFHAGNWHPLTWLSHMLDCELFGRNPGKHHFINLLFHMANSLLLFLVFRKMTGGFWQSALTAAFFALHPLHVESVVWLAERKDVLSTFFWMLTMLSYAAYVERTGAFRYLLVFVCLVLGLMSKPMLVTLPFVLLLMDYWPLRRIRFQRSGSQLSDTAMPPIRLLLEKVPLFAVVLLSSVVTFNAQQHGGAVKSLEVFPLGARIANSVVSYISYIIKMIWPAKMAILYPYPQEIAWWKVAGASAILVAITVAVIRVAVKKPYAAVGWFWYLGTLVPVIGLIQVGNQSMADRYTYVPLVGIFIMIVWGLSDLSAHSRHRNKWLPVSAAGSIMVVMAVTMNQVTYWKNSISLYEHALAVTSDNYAIHNNLGYVLAEQGRTAEAIRHYREALRIRPGFSSAHINLGLALAKREWIEEAIYHYQEALRLKPDSAKAYNNLGAALEKQGRYDEAVTHFHEALRIQPGQAGVQNNLGVVYGRLGRYDEAVKQFLTVLQKHPGDAATRNRLANILVAMDRMEEAAEQYRRVIENDPNHADAHNSLGVILLRSGKFDNAIYHFQKALKLNPDFKTARENLAEAAAAKKGFNDLVITIKQQIRDDPQNADLYLNLGDLYRSNQNSEAAIDAYQSALKIRPQFPEALSHLAMIYFVRNDYDRSLALFKAVVSLLPEHAATYYNIACVYARQKKTKDSIDWLKQAIEKGYANWELIKRDKDLEPIRSSPAYRALIENR